MVGDGDDAFTLAIGTPEPTQYCLSAAKLRGVLSWFDVDDPEYEALPVARVEHPANEGLGAAHANDSWLLLDGHTRAVCALLAGERSLRVRDATSDDDVDLAVYRTCRDWCRERGVNSVRDLVGETWSAERYEDEWLGRCERELGGG
ncbi:hypothetical protein [Halorubellus litoreus]|uniref:Histone acetyltransferase n=1 Tax=Halorubellus litoreus TaxID=755308 RepID=A0ABD5V7A4_9EURY